MKKKLMMVLAVMFPCIILLWDDNPGGAFVALVLQFTVIGWPVAAVWGVNVVNEMYPKNKPKV